jgi:uncharacterized SAM-binding protein YcdF (DUF218 family)
VASELIKWILTLLAVIAAGYYTVSHVPSPLVANDPVKSDVILVLAGDKEGLRFWRGMELMQQGYAPFLILDVQAPVVTFGVSDSALAKAFVAENAPGPASVCEVFGDSTLGETVDVAQCLRPLHASSVLIVTSAYHSRRALAIFKKRLPQYRWHVAAESGPLESGGPGVGETNQWWKDSRRAEVVLDEWEKWIWWCLVDRWRAKPIDDG